VHTPWIPNAEIPEKGANIRKNLKMVMAELDWQIGRLTDGLQDLGIDDETIVIFTSDNGPYPSLAGRTLGRRGCKLSLYEGGIRLPFIVRWPGQVPAGTVDATSIVASIDVLPTLCRIAGVELPAEAILDGEDVAQTLRGEPRPNRIRPLYSEYGRNSEFFPYPKNPKDRSPNLAIRDGNWKLLVNDDGSGAELYNLATDEFEANNVASKNAEVVDQLKADVLRWRRSIP
jgi:arylsulfatase A-like enzyme